MKETTDDLARGNVTLNDRSLLNIRIGTKQQWKERHELNVANTAQQMRLRANEERAHRRNGGLIKTWGS